MLGVLICLVSMVSGKCFAFAYGGSIGGSSLCLLLVWVLVVTAGSTAKGQYRASQWCEADMDWAGTKPTKAPWLLSVFIYECFRWRRVEIVSGIVRSTFPLLQSRPVNSCKSVCIYFWRTCLCSSWVVLLLCVLSPLVSDLLAFAHDFIPSSLCIKSRQLSFDPQLLCIKPDTILPLVYNNLQSSLLTTLFFVFRSGFSEYILPLFFLVKK